VFDAGEPAALFAGQASEGVLGEDFAAQVRGFAVAGENLEATSWPMYSARHTSP